MVKHPVKVSAIFFAMLCFACGAGGVRPTFQPFPQAIVDTVTGEPQEIVEHISELLRQEAIELRWVRSREGYVESEWFDPVSGEAGGGRSLNTAGIVRLRFWTDTVMEHQSVVVGEAVRRRVVDPSLPVRETEVHVAEDHEGYEILRRVIEGLSSGRLGQQH